MTMFAVFDPNWGEAVPLLSTIRYTMNEAMSAALMTGERETNIYSGAQMSCVPPRPGKWHLLEKQGYVVRRIRIEVVK